VKSVRLDADLQARLKAAARTAGVSESEFIRAAIDERSDATLAHGLEGRLTGLLGTIKSKGGRGNNAHLRYRELLNRRSARAPKSRS
jgi:hypothetical protein